MYKNNFDESSTGKNIEFSGFHDNWQAQNDFEECFSRLNDNLFFAKDWGNVKTPQTIGEVFKIKNGTKKSDLMDALGWESEETTKQDCIDEILESDLGNYQDFEELLTIKKEFEIKETRGYCQGDFATVVLNKEFSYSDEYLDNLFWDSPIYAKFKINGKKFDYNDYDLDCYNWQKEKFVELVSRDSGIDKKTLDSLCPEYLDYN